MLNIANEQLISLTDVAGHVPPRFPGKKTHLSTILRWILTGIKSPDGSRVRLEAVRLGGKWVTTRPAVQRFVEKLTPALDRGRPSGRSSAARQRATDRAESALSKAGI